jgi:hypothetical protein
MAHDGPEIRRWVEEGGAGLRGQDLSRRHERLDQLRIRPAMIQRIRVDRSTKRPSDRDRALKRLTAKSRRVTIAELLAYDLEQILR